MNVVILQGTVSSEPVTRHLPSGQTIVSLEMTAPQDETVASVPVAWYDPPAAVTFKVGEQITVIGSVRRRFFRNGGLTQSRTEVVAARVTTGTSVALAALVAEVRAVEL